MMFVSVAVYISVMMFVNVAVYISVMFVSVAVYILLSKIQDFHDY